MRHGCESDHVHRVVPSLWMISHELRDDRHDLRTAHTSNAVSKCSDLLPVVPSARRTEQRSKQHPIYNTHRVVVLAPLAHLRKLFCGQKSCFNRNSLLRETRNSEYREENKDRAFHYCLHCVRPSSSRRHRVPETQSWQIECRLVRQWTAPR